MAMDPTLVAALDAPHLRTFFAVRIFFQSTETEVLLHDGSGTLSFAPWSGDTKTFTGKDSIFGTLAALTTIEEKIASEAPDVSITLMAPSNAAFGEINDPRNQGSPVSVWFGLVDDMTGAVIGTPELLWMGRLDTVQSNVAANQQTCELVTVSGFDRLFIAGEGECLNSVWHQSIWPGETGLAYNVASTTDIPWGVEAPKPVTSPAGGYGYGGGYGGYGGGGGGGGGRNYNDHL